MKIAVWHNLPSGGGKRALHDHVKGLAARGHQIDIWQPSCADNDFFNLSSFAKTFIEPCRYSDTPATTRLNKLKRLMGHRSNLAALKKNAVTCAEKINTDKYDLLFANTCRFMASPFIGRYAKLPSVLYLQEPKRSIFEASGNNPLAYPSRPHGLRDIPRYIEEINRHNFFRIKAREEIRNARAFRKILVNSHFSRESVLRAYDIDSVVCYLGVDTKSFKREPQANRENIVLTVGALEKGKNVEFIVRALGIVKQPRPTLVIVSNIIDPVYRDRVVAVASKLDVPLKIYHQIPDEELIHLYSVARVLAYAPRLEPFGYIPLEAGSCSLPVVAVAEGGVRETVIDGQNGRLVDADPRAMAEVLATLLSDQTLSNEYGRNGRRMVEERWTIEKAVDRLETILLSMIR